MSTETVKRLGVVALLAMAAALVLVVAQPLGWPVFPRCALHALTGWHCPGCGTVRALDSLAHGHVLEAIRLNPVTLLLLPLVGWLWAAGRLDSARPGWIWTLLTVLIVFGVLRNVPYYPFTALVP